MSVIQRNNGVVALVGRELDEIAENANAKSALPNCFPLVSPYLNFHITLFTKDELRILGREAFQKIQDKHQDTKFVLHPLGIGGKKGVYFVVVIWALGQQIRKEHGFEPKDFHLTLTAVDNHNLDFDKSFTSLLLGQFDLQAADLDVELLDHLAFTEHNAGRLKTTKDAAYSLMLRDSGGHKGFLRLADAALQLQEYKLAMLAYAVAWSRIHDNANLAPVTKYAFKKLIDCSKHTEFGLLFTGDELACQLPEQKERADLLLPPWPMELRKAIQDVSMTPSLTNEPRERLHLPITSGNGRTFHRLPRFFSWLIPFRIALMSEPRNSNDIAALSAPALGITRVLTLTEENPLPAEWFNGQNIQKTFLPITNYKPPSLEQMDIALSVITSSDSILIHCGGGKGRAGTIAACYLIAFGFAPPDFSAQEPAMGASEAISTLRKLRPGSIETEWQEQFISTWTSMLWKRQSVMPPSPEEPAPCPLEIEGNGLETVQKADLLMLIGVQGSGKSFFSKSLLARNSKGWDCISQDEAGSRGACENALGHASNAKTKTILDRCNVTATDRKSLLALAQASHPVAVWFDYSSDLCTARAQARGDHPTLPPGSRVRSAIKHMTTQFQRPTTAEGFKSVLIVRSFAAGEEAIRALSPEVKLLKFPRTPHLLNLGAATDDDFVVKDLSLIGLSHASKSKTTNSTNAATLQDTILITEKIDGANLGFSISNTGTLIVQNRSHTINSATHEQFKKLDTWIEKHREGIYKILTHENQYFPGRWILYGEWMYATHSIPYSHLPDLFLAFDLYDRQTGRFLDRGGIERRLEGTGVGIVPVMEVRQDVPDEKELREMVQRPSVFYDGRVEGVYVKVERAGEVRWRGKVVRSDFLSGSEHWTKGGVRRNGVLDEFAAMALE
jgi:atypical dual specificity phosphatase